jgi:DNA-binding NarL/FixJ family response regulator
MLRPLPMRVVVADDHRLFRQGLIGLMHTRPDLVQVIGEANTGAEAVRLAAELRPDLILMDISMPGLDGLQAARAIRQSQPDIAVVMLTASELDVHLYEAVQLGAAGYLLKSLDAAELFELLESVAHGEAALTRALAARLLKSVAWHSANPGDAVDALTEREVEVLRLVAQGASNPQIAAALTITVNTVKVHLRNILDKLQLANRTQAATFALQNGLLPPAADPVQLPL